MKSMMMLSTTAAMIAGATALAATWSNLDERAFAPIETPELEFQQSSNAYEAIDALRHDWLAGAKSTRELPTVFIELPCSDIECLRWIANDQVEEIRYVRSHAPHDGWPPTNDHGSIVVTLRTRSTVLTPDVDRQ